MQQMCAAAVCFSVHFVKSGGIYKVLYTVCIEVYERMASFYEKALIFTKQP